MPMGNTAHLGPRETVCGCVTRPLLQIKLGCNTDKNQNTFISKLTIMVSANKLNDYNEQKKSNKRLIISKLLRVPSRLFNSFH